jgi:RNA polymerase sigma-70 factor (ECF subfamily)
MADRKPPTVAGVPTDEELVNLAKAGSDAAFKAIVERHERRLLTFAKWRCGNTAKAEDMVQTTFLNFFRCLGSYEERGQLKGFLLKILRNVRCTREMPTVPPDALLSIPSPDISPEDLLVASKECLLAYTVLKPSQLDVLLYLRDGYSNEETAEELGTSVKRVKSRRKTAVKAILARSEKLRNGRPVRSLLSVNEVRERIVELRLRVGRLEKAVG